MERDNDPKRLGSHLSSIYQRKEWKHQWVFFLLVQQWPNIAGREIGAQSRPAFLRNRELWVYVDNSSLMQHIHLQKVDLLARIRERFPDLKLADIRWLCRPGDEVTETAPSRIRPELPAESRPAAKRQYSRFQELTKTISDLECRESLNNLYRCFQKQSATNE